MMQIANETVSTSRLGGDERVSLFTVYGLQFTGLGLERGVVG